jgi:sirohydrochlorin ferrochelatase
MAPRPGGDALLLVAHGSRDPRAEAAIDALAARVAAARPGLPVGVATLELRGRRVAEVAAELAGGSAAGPAVELAAGPAGGEAGPGGGEAAAGVRGGRAGGARRIVVVPLLLTNAYHGSVDLPAVLESARAALPGVELVAGDVLGPDDRLLDALDERIPDRSDHSDGSDDSDRSGRLVGCFDGIVLAVAGTRDPAAARGIEAVAARYGVRHGVPCLPVHASAGEAAVSRAADALRATTTRARHAHRKARPGRVLVVSYFLAPGLLHDRIVVGAQHAGGLTVTEPFADTGSVTSLVFARYREALDRRSVLAA